MSRNYCKIVRILFSCEHKQKVALMTDLIILYVIPLLNKAFVRGVEFRLAYIFQDIC